MSMTDTVADFLTRLRNAISAGKSTVRAPFSNLKVGVAEVLKREGFISNFEIEKNGNKSDILVHIKRDAHGSSVISVLKRLSKPGCRRYVRADELKPVLNGVGTSIVSTNAGVLSDRECREKKVGGEILCEIW